MSRRRPPKGTTGAGLGLALALAACRPTAPPPAGDPALRPEPPMVAAADAPPPGATAPEAGPLPLVFTEAGWTRDPDDPGAALLRFTLVRPGDSSDPKPLRPLLDVLEPLMACYEVEPARPTDRGLAIHLRRDDEAHPTPDGFTLTVHAPAPDGLAACMTPVLRDALPPATQDHGAVYELSFYPRRELAPRLPQPQPDEEVLTREGGSCWLRETYPCKPHKRCMAPRWIRSRCRPPTDREGVVLRWALGPADAEQQHPRTGLSLVSVGGEVLWTSPLTEAVAQRLGPVHHSALAAPRPDARAPLGALWIELRPHWVLLADRAGVRAHERRTGRERFTMIADARGPEAMFFDTGTYKLRGHGHHCKGRAKHGALAVRCDELLVYFDGFTMAVIELEPPMKVVARSNLAASSSTYRRGHVIRPGAMLRDRGYTLNIEGLVFL